MVNKPSALAPDTLEPSLALGLGLRARILRTRRTTPNSNLASVGVRHPGRLGPKTSQIQGLRWRGQVLPYLLLTALALTGVEWVQLTL